MKTISQLSAHSLAALGAYSAQVRDWHPIWDWVFARCFEECDRRRLEEDGAEASAVMLSDPPAFESCDVISDAVRELAAFAVGVGVRCPEPNLPHHVQEELQSWAQGMVEQLDPSVREELN